MTTETIKQEVIELISDLFKDKGFDIDIIEYVDLVENELSKESERLENIVNVEA